MSRYDNKTALVTGAGSGIGKAVCQRLLAEGAFVVAVDRIDVNAADFGEDPSRVTTVVADLAAPIPDDFVDRLGAIDVLVNAAGVLHRSPIAEHSLEQWQSTITVNIEAPYRLCSLFVRQRLRLAAPGAIVNVCSIESFTAAPHHIAYTASKTAVLMMTRAFSAELAQHGVRVNGIAPGVTETGMNQALRSDPTIAQALTSRIPMRRFGLPHEQAAAVAFLASDEAAYITGAVLPVDGGWLTT